VVGKHTKEYWKEEEWLRKEKRVKNYPRKIHLSWVHLGERKKKGEKREFAE